MARQEHVGDGARADVDRASVLSVLTTEHFTLQSARASTIGESSARAYLYVGAVSSALIALGFIGQASEFGAEFDAFALVVLPTVYLLGLFTFVRLVQTSMEDLFYGRAINRIRSYYLQLLGDDSGYLLLGGHDDVYGVLANMGITKPSRWQLYLTLATMIAVLNSVVGGTTIALQPRRSPHRPWLLSSSAQRHSPRPSLDTAPCKRRPTCRRASRPRRGSPLLLGRSQQPARKSLARISPRRPTMPNA